MGRRLLSLLTLSSTFAVALVVACSDDDGAADPHGSGDAAARDSGRLAAPLRPDASCPVVIDTPELLPSPHVPEGSALQFNSNPPASGAHFPVWAAFQEYDQPVPRGYWLHSLEHGAIVLLYKCDQPGGCPSIVEGLRQVRDSVQTDPRCDPAVRVRVVITPDPELDVPVAAAAWGWTYKADCLDVPTLQAFARDRYAQGPENTCAAGKTTF